MPKEKLTLSVSPGTKEKLEKQAKRKGFTSISSYLDAIANEKPSAEISEAIANIHQQLKKLAKDTGCQ